MVKKWILLAGAGIGYVLGTRAGRQKYDAMVAKTREVLENPTVKDAKLTVQAEANRLYGEGRRRVQDKMRDLRDSGRHTEPDLSLEQRTAYTPGARTVPPTLESLNEDR